MAEDRLRLPKAGSDMTYFVTGATGFIGHHLVKRLLARKGDVHCLVRKGSLEKFDALRARFGDDGKRLIAVHGDLAKPSLGVTPSQRKAMAGKVKHFFHLAAIYDLAADARSQETANIDGTRHALELAEQVKAGCFHHMSSIAVAGMYPGVFREDMFAEAEDLDHPYFRTKHEPKSSCALITSESYRIYRLGSSRRLAVGRDRQDRRPLLFLPALKLRQRTAMDAGDRYRGRPWYMVPVIMSSATDHIAHKPSRRRLLPSTFLPAAHRRSAQHIRARRS
jgi:hypothetical protein